MSTEQTSRARLPVAVIGAGPYGLAAAAHLGAAGVPARVFGVPMEFWSRHMPAGMLLRSSKRSSHLSDPDRRFTLDAWERATGSELTAPIRLEDFVAYGRWFAERIGADIDERRVERVARRDGGFELTLADRSSLEADRVVVAAGLRPFGRSPAVLADLDGRLVSHACDHADLTLFAGRHVAVVGGGQSALESAALLHEGGARVEVIARTGAIHWLADALAPKRLRDRGFPPTDVGGRRTGWIAAVPDVFRRMPPGQQASIAAACLRPAGSHWLRARLADVPIRTGLEVTAARAAGEGVELSLSDGSVLACDHVLLGTGYAVDVAGYPFLDPDLGRSIERVDGLPVLRAGLESSVAGLHFLGAPAVRSFGPIMRFVAGSWYAAPALVDAVAGRRRRRLLRAYA